MSRHHETNPHFLPRQQDPIIQFPSQAPPPSRSRLPSPRRHGRTSPPPYHGRTPPRGRAWVEPPPQGRTSSPPPHGRAWTETPPHHGRMSSPPPPHGRTPVEPPPHGRAWAETPPHSRTRDQAKPVVPVKVELPQHEARPHSEHLHHHGFIHTPGSRRTKPVAWLLAAFCTLFWILVIVGGLVILIVYLVFRPRNPRFDISSTTFNAAYLDMGTLLNADVTLLANFTNPNTKVKVEFSYVILDLYYANNFVATRYIEPFSVMKGESKFADVHMMASQVKMSPGHSLQLQKQIEEGRVNLEIKGLFRARSKLGGIFRYSYWMYANCHIVVTGPPTGVLIGKKCVTKRNI